MKSLFGLFALFTCIAGLAINHNGQTLHVPEASDSDYYSLLLNGTTYSVVAGRLSQAVAYAYYAKTMNTTGWAYLAINTNDEFDDAVQMYAAGFLESALTRDLIYQSWYNEYINQFNSKPPPADLVMWVNKNVEYMNKQIQANSATSPYWYQVGLVWQQLKGLVDGYTAVAAPNTLTIGMTEFLLVNMDGDLTDLLPALNVSQRFPDWEEVTPLDISNWIFRNGHCSALIKVTPDYSDLFSGHTTWTSFYEMVRILKSYNFPLSGSKGSAAIKTLFSGYAGTLSSVDDFYVIDTGLVVIETTNGIMNNTLYDLITPQSVLSWVRVIVANRMATSGAQWVSVFSEQNSGTYNNQWIVVDHKKFVPGRYFEDGTLTVLEQIPGYIESKDVTANLETGYWPSFNVPFFEYVFNVSGFWSAFNKYGPLFSYQNNPRARIFRRDANNVAGVHSMQKMMRYNDWLNDPLSDDNPGNAISSRFDLVNAPNPNPFLVQGAFGGVDSKMTSATLSQVNPTMWAQSGPTHDQQPPFRWDNTLWKDISHEGQPDVWAFDWQKFGTQPDLSHNDDKN
eukprot:TRINITY_DN1719_c0_g1_i2.p1 TRINITY_DN1719_c0_g1~~TRINITY_DN1719_c0_g1_i2.p1  ORF type:complete len:584 (+),score=142.12 TRINITY_DN1719_c0_g1_i2:60-1754(+)